MCVCFVLRLFIFTYRRFMVSMKGIFPILADIVMERILDCVTPKFNFVPKVFCKYVDDLFCVIPKSERLNVIGILNSENSKIQFTDEPESESCLTYLDIKLIRDADGTILSDWYSKDTSSNRLLNYHSNHPSVHKINVMDNLISRVFGLSSKRFHDKNRELTVKILTENQYPKPLILGRIDKFFNKSMCQKRVLRDVDSSDVIVSDPKKVVFKGISYIDTVSFNLSKIVCEDSPDLKIGYKPIKSNRLVFTKLKDPTTLGDSTHVVYKIPCFGNGWSNNKCSLSYVGQTGNRLQTRMNQHNKDIVDSNEPHPSNKGQTALVRHFQDGHAPDFENVSVLSIECNDFKRKVLESLHILTENSVNFRQDVQNIDTVYHGLIHEKKSKDGKDNKSNEDGF